MRAIKTAHLVLKNRSNRNHKTRIVVFIGSPLDSLECDYGEGEVIFRKILELCCFFI